MVHEPVDSRQCHRLVTEHRRMLQSSAGSFLTLRLRIPRHALFGNRFAVLTGRSGRGPAVSVVIELPDGRRRSIRIASTDLAEALALAPIAANLPRISVRTLIPLMQHLNGICPSRRGCIRDGPASPPRSRCVSTAAADPGKHIKPAGGTPSASMAEPPGRDPNADGSASGRAYAADAPERPPKGEADADRTNPSDEHSRRPVAPSWPISTCASPR